MEKPVFTHEKKRGFPGWCKILLTVVLTLLVSIGGMGLLLGQNGLSLIQGYLLARFAFVDTQADLDGAVDKALAGLVEGLGDRWSYYLTEESYQQTMVSRANQYVGIGVTVTYEREEGLLVVDVASGGPAEAAGIGLGDVICQVDGLSLAGDDKYENAQYISGEEGTQVELTLLGVDGTTRTVTCTRATVHSISATGELLEDNVGYVRITDFYSGCAQHIANAVDDLVAQGATSLVFDVRSNPGGYVNELIDALDYLLPEGPIFTEDGRWSKEKVYESDESCIDLPMVVLVNADSYSAAELFAAQLRESVDAPIVGEVTSGKGYAQATFPLSNGGGMGISVSTYSTGGGHSLIGEGITPDVELELDVSQGTDNQLEAALELLK